MLSDRAFSDASQLVAGLKPAHELHPLFDQFLLAGLNGEVALGKGDRLLSRVAVLGDQVAGVAGEHEIFDLDAPHRFRGRPFS